MQGVRIFPGRSLLLSELRLAALADSPAAFCASYDDEASFSDDDWYTLTRSAAWFTVVSEQGEYIGLIAGRRVDDATVEAISMWVAPSARRTGVGALLLRTLEQWVVLEGARRITLEVTADNDSAATFYLANGFSVAPIVEEGATHLVADLPLPTLT